MENSDEKIKVTSNEILEIINEHKTRSNKDFELTKESVIKMTKHLDNLEISYNTILKEYKKRNG